LRYKSSSFLNYNRDIRPNIAPSIISHAVNQAPNNEATIPHNSNSIAVGTFQTNFAPPAQTMPKTSMTIPQKKAVRENNGAKISQKIPKIPARPRIIRMIPPNIAKIKPMFASVRFNQFTSFAGRAKI